MEAMLGASLTPADVAAAIAAKRPHPAKGSRVVIAVEGTEFEGMIGTVTADSAKAKSGITHEGRSVMVRWCLTAAQSGPTSIPRPGRCYFPMPVAVLKAYEPTPVTPVTRNTSDRG
jgi:hypothetical protein